MSGASLPFFGSGRNAFARLYPQHSFPLGCPLNFSRHVTETGRASYFVVLPFGTVPILWALASSPFCHSTCSPSFLCSTLAMLSPFKPGMVSKVFRINSQPSISLVDTSHSSQADDEVNIRRVAVKLLEKSSRKPSVGRSNPCPLMTSSYPTAGVIPPPPMILLQAKPLPPSSPP